MCVACLCYQSVFYAILKIKSKKIVIPFDKKKIKDVDIKLEGKELYLLLYLLCKSFWYSKVKTEFRYSCKLE